MSPTPEAIRSACEDLARKDTALASAYQAIGVPDWRHIEPNFQSIARIVTFQLLSTTAAGAIWTRVLDWSGGALHPAHMRSDCEEDLRACGLSRPKISHLKSIATALEDGTPSLKALTDLDDASARKALIAVKGIGPWTAEIVLMSALGRINAFPEGDVGLMEAYRMLRDDAERLKPRPFLEQAENWRPYRGVAAHLLWGFINQHRENKV